MSRIINGLMAFLSFALIFMAYGVGDIFTAFVMFFTMAICVACEAFILSKGN